MQSTFCSKLSLLFCVIFWYSFTLNPLKNQYCTCAKLVKRPFLHFGPPVVRKFQYLKAFSYCPHKVYLHFGYFQESITCTSPSASVIALITLGNQQFCYLGFILLHCKAPEVFLLDTFCMVHQFSSSQTFLQFKCWCLGFSALQVIHFQLQTQVCGAILRA